MTVTSAMLEVHSLPQCNVENVCMLQNTVCRIIPQS